MTEDAIKKYLLSALVTLFEKDNVLFEIGVHERTLTFRLGLYLSALIVHSGYQVDCEYNRDHGCCKVLQSAGLYDKYRELKQKEPKERGVQAYPDVIVHRRKTDDNLLVVEAKPIGCDPDREEFDFEKLKAYRSYLGYQVAAFVSFPNTSVPFSEKEHIKFI